MTRNAARLAARNAADAPEPVTVRALAAVGLAAAALALGACRGPFDAQVDAAIAAARLEAERRDSLWAAQVLAAPAWLDAAPVGVDDEKSRDPGRRLAATAPLWRPDALGATPTSEDANGTDAAARPFTVRSVRVVGPDRRSGPEEGDVAHDPARAVDVTLLGDIDPIAATESLHDAAMSVVLEVDGDETTARDGGVATPTSASSAADAMDENDAPLVGARSTADSSAVSTASASAPSVATPSVATSSAPTPDAVTSATASDASAHDNALRHAPRIEVVRATGSLGTDLVVEVHAAEVARLGVLGIVARTAAHDAIAQRSGAAVVTVLEIHERDAATGDRVIVRVGGEAVPQVAELADCIALAAAALVADPSAGELGRYLVALDGAYQQRDAENGIDRGGLTAEAWHAAVRRELRRTCLNLAIDDAPIEAPVPED